MEALLNYAQVGLTFLLVLTVLVGVHEYGHYIVARLFGMRVKAFAIMMGGLRDPEFARQEGGKVGPAWQPWLVGVLSAVVTVVGGLGGNKNLYLVGMCLLAFAMPVWIVNRLGQIYRVGMRETVNPLITGYGLFLLVALFSARGQTTFSQQLALLFFGGWMAVLLAYYRPVLGKEPELDMGNGEVTTAAGEKLKVKFRPVVATKDKNGTEYSLLALPLGGFCAIAGMNPEIEGDVPDGFYGKAAWKRFLVLFAGPLFSLALGWVLLTGYIKSTGLPNGQLFVHSFSPESKADEAGLKKGDEVLAVNGKKLTGDLLLTDLVQDITPGQSARFEVRRNDQTLTFAVPTYTSKEQRVRVTKEGLRTGEKYFPTLVGLMTMPGIRDASWGESFSRSFTIPFEMAAGLFNLAKQPTLVTHNVGGAASMVVATKEATDDGWGGVLRMAGLLSMSLGVMNLLPIQPLDGGQMMVQLYEMIRGKRMSAQAMGWVTSIGVLLILLLMFTVLVADVARFTGG